MFQKHYLVCTPRRKLQLTLNSPNEKEEGLLSGDVYYYVVMREKSGKNSSSVKMSAIVLS